MNQSADDGTILGSMDRPRAGWHQRRLSVGKDGSGQGEDSEPLTYDRISWNQNSPNWNLTPYEGLNAGKSWEKGSNEHVLPYKERVGPGRRILYLYVRMDG